MTDGLGENAAGALNALVPVPAPGDGQRPCVEAFRFVRAYSRIRRSPLDRAPASSHDALSMFEAMTSILAYATGGRPVGDLDLRTDALVMCIS